MRIIRTEHIMKQFVVDAFTDEVFRGNPAAVCVLDEWPEESLMQKIAIENNLSETAFIVKEGGKYHIRWFSPGGEIDLCGHATLASSFVLFNYFTPGAERIDFTSMSGDLTVSHRGDMYELQFPAYDLRPVEVTDLMEEVIGRRPVEAYISRDLLCVIDDEEFIRGMTPDFDRMLELDGLLLHVTAAGNDTDCVSRTFAPKLAVNEDPVCGSGHCHIVPYWADKTGKDEIVAYQASRRGGTLYCRRDAERVFLAGKAALFSIDELFI